MSVLLVGKELTLISLHTNHSWPRVCLCKIALARVGIPHNTDRGGWLVAKELTITLMTNLISMKMEEHWERHGGLLIYILLENQFQDY